jgi:hypothetical protein
MAKSLTNNSKNTTVLSKQDTNTLKEYEIHLRRAKDGYVRGIYTSDLNRLEPIYNKLGQQLENRHCASCVLGMLTFLANEYFTE